MHSSTLGRLNVRKMLIDRKMFRGFFGGKGIEEDRKF